MIDGANDGPFQEEKYFSTTVSAFNKILRSFFIANGQNSEKKSTSPQTVDLSAAMEKNQRIFG